jgi:hypothetical protein
VSPWLQSSFCNNSACVQAKEVEFNSATASNPSGACVQAAHAEFVKSKDSSMNGGCIEAAQAEFVSAEDSNSGDSLEAARHQSSVIFLRDSKDPRCETEDFDHLHYTYEEWNGGRAVQLEKISIFLVPQAVVDARVAKAGHSAGAWYKVNHEGEGVTLYFDQDEKDAWEDGIEKGEFNFEKTTV